MGIFFRPACKIHNVALVLKNLETPELGNNIFDNNSIPAVLITEKYFVQIFTQL